MKITSYKAKEIFPVNTSDLNICFKISETALKFNCHLLLKNHYISSFIYFLNIYEYATMTLLDGICNLLNDFEFPVDCTKMS